VSTQTGTAVAGGPLLDLQRSAGLLYTLSPHHPPVLSVDPGARIRIETELNIGDVLHEDGDRFTVDMVKPRRHPRARRGV